MFLVDAEAPGISVRPLEVMAPHPLGEVRFHDLLAARAAGVGLILPGHYATERPAVEELAERLQGEFPGVAVWASRAERDPAVVLA